MANVIHSRVFHQKKIRTAQSPPPSLSSLSTPSRPSSFRSRFFSPPGEPHRSPNPAMGSAVSTPAAKIIFGAFYANKYASGDNNIQPFSRLFVRFKIGFLKKNSSDINVNVVSPLLSGYKWFTLV